MFVEKCVVRRNKQGSGRPSKSVNKREGEKRVW